VLRSNRGVVGLFFHPNKKVPKKGTANGNTRPHRSRGHGENAVKPHSPPAPLVFKKLGEALDLTVDQIFLPSANWGADGGRFRYLGVRGADGRQHLLKKDWGKEATESFAEG